MIATALPYFQLRGSGVIQPFGMIALAGLALGVLTTVLIGRARKIPGGQLGLITPIAGLAVIFGAHWFDVAWYQWDHASENPKLWIQIMQGVSVFGGVAGAALVIWPLAKDKPLWADIAALGMLVGLTVGRIGCTLVHDHLGAPTDLPIGLDVPVNQLWVPEARSLADGASSVRLHDVGMEEFFLLVPLLIAAFALRKRYAPGTLAAIIAIGYAVIRFPLEFLRLPSTEPVRLGLTGAQWGCLVMVVVTIVLLSLRHRDRLAVGGQRTTLGDPP